MSLAQNTAYVPISSLYYVSSFCNELKAPPAIYVDNVMTHNEIMISLDCYRGITKIEKLDNEEIKQNDDGVVARATVRAGTCLGLNRKDPTSTKSNGLVYELESKGYALADLGGVVMQVYILLDTNV